MPPRRQNRNQIVSTAENLDNFRNDYDAAKKTRFNRTLKGYSSSGSGADYHLRNQTEFLFLIEQARHYDRDDPIVGRGITSVVDNVLQGGPRLDPKTGNDKGNARIVELWGQWSTHPDECDSQKEHKLHAIGELSLRAALVDGDIFNLPLQDGRIQTIEAHRCRTPNTKRNVALGVLLAESRERLQYWFTKEDISPTRAVSRVGDMIQYPARDGNGNRQVFQLYNPKRLTQTRGVTITAPIRHFIGMHDDIQFAKLVQQNVVSCYAIFRELPEVFEGSSKSDPKGVESTETLSDGSTREVEGIAPGMEYTGRPGEKLQGFSPNVPNAEYFEHISLILSIIAVNLGIPVQVLLLDANRTNFSGWRGAMDQARVGFTRVYDWTIDGFYDPIYEWKIRQWMDNDPELKRIRWRKKDNPFGHEWSRPHWPYIEPAKDAKADQTIVDENLNSRRRVLARRGLDIDKIDTEIVADAGQLVERAIEEAIRINEAFPDAGVEWRELIHFEAAAPAPVEVAPDDDDDDPNDPDGKGKTNGK